MSGGGILKAGGATAGKTTKTVSYADQQEAAVKAAPDAVGTEQVEVKMIDEKATPGEAASAPVKPAKVGEFPAVKADKVVRLKGTDVPFEQKQQ